MKLHHIGIAVTDMQDGHDFWNEIMGLPEGKAYRENDQGVDVAFFPTGDANIELIYPYDKENGVSKFINKRGPGMHHICFQVSDLEAKLAELKAKGIQLIDEVPRINGKGVKVAFIHPKSTGGVLVEFYEMDEEQSRTWMEWLRSIPGSINSLTGSLTDYVTGGR